MLTEAVRAAGVVGEGGAGFPAHVKYAARVQTVIANGCECEPLLHSDQHLMLAHAGEIVSALTALKEATGASRAVIATKAKYGEAAAALKAAMAGHDLELALLDNFYPAGDEQVLVHELTGRTVPPLGLPGDVGALVANVGTLVSAAGALAGRPVTDRVITVTGAVRSPGVWLVPIGTPLAGLLDACGGPEPDDPVFMVGGPMMGRLVDGPEALAAEVATKTSGGLIVLPRGHYLHRMAGLSLHQMQRQAAAACIQCRQCTELCPRYLIGHGFETHRVMRVFAAGGREAMGAMQAFMCCECGVCEMFACPMRLSPRRINAMFKHRFAQEQVRYQGPREVWPEQQALRPFRKVPLPRLALRLDIARYMDLHPEFAGAIEPQSVRIPLAQHIGAPAAPVVRPGQKVRRGDLLGEIPEGALGARVHASLDGVVAAVDQAVEIRGS